MVDVIVELGKILFASLLGGLIGIEREFIRRFKKTIPMGTRTLVLICLFGNLTVLLSDLIGNDWITIMGLIGVITFAALSFYSRYKAYKEKGLTTYSASLVTYLIGLLVGYNELLIAVIVTVVTVIILSLGDEVKELVSVMNERELNATLLFAIIALVILPILPNTVIDPLGVFNPFSFWLLVVIISALSFTSYILLRVVKNGLFMTGLLGGVINAKVTVYQLVSKAKKQPSLRRDAFNGVLVCSASSLASMLIIVVLGTLSFKVLTELFIPLILVSGLILLLFLRREKRKGTEKLKLSNPFTFGSALKIAFLIFIFSEVIYLLTNFIHPSLIYPSIALSSFVSFFATIASIVSLYTAGNISEMTVANLVMVASMVSVLGRLVFIRMGGDVKIFRKMVLPIILWFSLITVYFIVRQFLPI